MHVGRRAPAFLSRLLWWKRRPYYPASERVVDMSDVITELDPNLSYFTTLLMQMPKSSTLSGPRWNDWGDWSWTEYPAEAREALFYFEEQQKVREAPKVHWLEDEFMPRLLGEPRA